MATNNKSTVTGAKKPEAKEAPVAATPAESVYPAEELAKAHKVFDTSYEIIMVALKMAGKKEATVTEAKKIIKEFKDKEVK